MSAAAVAGCACAKCREACKRNPGWFTPAEARRAIEAGFANRLMRDWLEPSTVVGNKERIYVLAPASEGYEGDDAPEIPEYESILEAMFAPPFEKGRCIFFSKDERCEIHDSEFKPIQCRTAFTCRREVLGGNASASNFIVARMWDTDEGREVIAVWEKMK